MKIRHGEKEIAGRVVAFLTRPEIDYIDSLAKDALFSTGHKLSRTDIIRAVIDCVKSSKINGKGISSRQGLEKRLYCCLQTALPDAVSEIIEARGGHDNN
ncbi:MAG: hypothetical protein PHV77_06305 [Candidatus Omnitrophica bacterium]|nr:hypothetical protein [Candidatus Omnitrophota bacterium]